MGGRSVRLTLNGMQRAIELPAMDLEEHDALHNICVRRAVMRILQQHVTCARNTNELRYMPLQIMYIISAYVRGVLVPTGTYMYHLYVLCSYGLS